MRTNIELNDRLRKAETDGLCVWGVDSAQRQVLRRREKSGELIRVGARCFARADYWKRLSHTERFRHYIRTLARIHPHWVFGGPTAAAIHGISDSRRLMSTVHRMTNRNAMTRGGDIVRCHFIKEMEYVVVDGVRVTTLEKTAFDCSRWLDLPDALPILEEILRQRRMGKQLLERFFLTASGHHRGKALRALRYANGRTENGGEAYVFGVIVDEGYMPPRLQVPLPCVNENGNPDRVDFFWRAEDGRTIAGELDGRIKYRDPSMYRNGSLPDTIIAEKEREERVRLVVDAMFRCSFAEALQRGPLIRKLDHAGVPKIR
ncbi:hypothetical protein KIH77_04210 [Bifidobacterium sp. 82T24]|uniref:type IV toxin-antitoxin system AbiEi family antitoxin domain-containing protein n=1 Tax=Bifidobacterium pluvialisilvae TaxID=2834436 RepID=UPI001C592DFD|nr:hypothetical protein [Bifidobacterium pluvialisilvae]MBW3087937.1 hypothetical protein [Bifidobacterium pluvialisilvae]